MSDRMIAIKFDDNAYATLPAMESDSVEEIKAHALAQFLTETLAVHFPNLNARFVANGDVLSVHFSKVKFYYPTTVEEIQELSRNQK